MWHIKWYFSLCPPCCQAFREAVPKLLKLAEAAKPGVADASTLLELSASWSIMAKAHDIHARHEEQVIFPELEAYFPGQVGYFGARGGHRALMVALMESF